MATYTPNLNLGKPEATDPFGNFRQLFNDNMDILDNGGGGGGGHTIVDPSGTDLPQEAKLQFTGAVSVTDDNVNGATVVNVSGGNNLILDAEIYSTKEQVVGVWTDQKPLYQISYVFTPTALSKSIDVTSLNIEKIIKNVGTFKRNANGTIQEKPLEYRTEAPSSNNYGIQHELRGTNLLIAINGYPYTEILEIRCTIQYTKTTDTAGSGGFQAYGFSPIIYSDVERVVGVWRDNKPLYQKTINFGALPNADQKAVNHNISDLDQLISVNAVAIGATNNFSLSYIDTNSLANGIGIYVSNTAITIRCGSNRSSHNAYVTLQYTKTTDVAGSGDYNTYGVPTVHYSTNEQVVGTWVDGSTLYERTVFNNGSAITANAGAWTSICSEAWVANVKSIINGNLTRQGTLGNVLVTPVEFTCNSGSIKINPLRNMTYQADGYFTIQYTKTS